MKNKYGRISVELGNMGITLDSIANGSGIRKDELIRLAVLRFIEKYEEPKSALREMVSLIGSI